MKRRTKLIFVLKNVFSAFLGILFMDASSKLARRIILLIFGILVLVLPIEGRLIKSNGTYAFGIALIVIGCLLSIKEIQRLLTEEEEHDSFIAKYNQKSKKRYNKKY